MKKYIEAIKKHRIILVIYLAVLIFGYTLIYLFTNLSSVTLQENYLKLFIFDYNSFQFDNFDISTGISLISLQILMLFLFGGLLKIFNLKVNQIFKFITFSILILFFSIFISNVTFPFIIKIMQNHTSGSFSIPGTMFIQYQFQIWLLLNALFLPVLLAFLGLNNYTVTAENFIIIFGIIFLTAGLVTPPDVFSQILIGIIISVFWLIGFWSSKAFKKQSPNIIINENKEIYFSINSGLLLLTISLSPNGSISVPEILILISVLLLVQNLIIIGKIFKIDIIAGILSLIIPFYFPYYILRNIKEVFHNKIFYKVYSIFLILLTIAGVFIIWKP